VDKRCKTLTGDFIHSLLTAPGPDMQLMLGVKYSTNILIFKGI